MSYFNTSMIVFDYNVCPTLILAVFFWEVLRFAVGVYICVHNRHLYLSVVKFLLYAEAFKTRYVLAEFANESSRMAVYSSCFFITSKPWLFVRVFLQGCLATSAHDEVAAHNMYQP